MNSNHEDLVDLCPECGLEVFILLPPSMGIQKYRCVEPGCEWTGEHKDVNVRKRVS